MITLMMKKKGHIKIEDSKIKKKQSGTTLMILKKQLRKYDKKERKKSMITLMIMKKDSYGNARKKEKKLCVIS